MPQRVSRQRRLSQKRVSRQRRLSRRRRVSQKRVSRRRRVSQKRVSRQRRVSQKRVSRQRRVSRTGKQFKTLVVYHSNAGLEITIDGKKKIYPDDYNYTKVLSSIFKELPNTLVKFTYLTRFPDAVYYKGLRIPQSVRKLELSVLSKISKKNLGNPTNMYLDVMEERDINRRINFV